MVASEVVEHVANLSLFLHALCSFLKVGTSLLLCPLALVLSSQTLSPSPPPFPPSLSQEAMPSSPPSTAPPPPLHWP